MLARDEQNRLTAIWTEVGRAGATLHYALRVAPGRWTPPAQVAIPPGSVLAPAITRDSLGRVWLAYQNGCTVRHHIFLTWLAGAEWAFPQRISDGDGHCFAPALCPFGEGVRVVWDGRIDGRYYLFMREMDTEVRLSKRESQGELAEADTLLANPAIVALDRECSLVVYERAQPGWGRRNAVPRGGREALTRENFLHARRELRGLVVSPDGRADLAADLNTGSATSCRTRPRLARTDAGAILLSYRLIDSLAEADPETGFRQVLTQYRAGDFEPVASLDASGGTSNMPANFAVDGAHAPLLGYTSRKDQTYRVHIAEIASSTPAGCVRAGKPRPLSITSFRRAKGIEPVTLDGDFFSPRLLWGDLHRHSDLSACKWWIEGSPTDAYRYALAVAELDFFALTDHAWYLQKPDTRAESHELANAHNVPGIFTAFCAYEANFHAGDGHMVVLGARPALNVPNVKTRKALLAKLDPADTVVIPHHPGDPNHPYQWKGHNETLGPVAEIYQPYRTSFESAEAPRPRTSWKTEGNEILDRCSLMAAWKAGLKIGVVASSDHLSTLGAYAAVWARGNTRDDILEALRARRCYAATDKIELAFWADDHVMGESFTTHGREVTFRIRIRGTDKLKKVELLLDGERAHTFKPGSGKGERAVGKKTLTVQPGRHFAYVRVHQAGDHMAWSSPVWFEVK